MAEAVMRQEDGVIDYTTAAATSAGEVLQLRDGRAGVAQTDVDSGDVVGMKVAGLHLVAKTATQVWQDGGPIWWDHSANTATCVPRMGASDRDFFLGVAVGDALSAATTGYVNLNVQPRYEIDLARDAFVTAVVKTVVGSTTVEVPHVEPRGGGVALILGTTAEAQKVDVMSERSFAVGSKWIVEGEVTIETNSDNAAGDFNIGVASGTSATDFDAIAEIAAIHTDGNSLNINVQSDDGTTDPAIADTTLDFVAGTPFSYVLDGRDMSNVKFYIDGVEVNAATTDIGGMPLAAGPLKLIAHLEKTSDDSPGTYVINKLRVRTAQR
jgi:predicted RecA/RadA family phage recombinase